MRRLEHILTVRGLRTEFSTTRGIVRAVDGVDLEIGKGEVLGLVGESGCGKSVTALSIMYLIPTPPGRIASGEVWFEGTNLTAESSEEVLIREGRGGRFKMIRRDSLLRKHRARMNKIRGRRISMIFQEPMSSLNPVLSVGYQVAEILMFQRRRQICESLLSRKEITAADVDEFKALCSNADATERQHLLADFCMSTGLSVDAVEAIVETSGLKLEERVERIRRLAARRRVRNRWFLELLRRLDAAEDAHFEREWRELSRLSLGRPAADLFDSARNPKAAGLPPLLRVTPTDDALRLFFKGAPDETVRDRVQEIFEAQKQQPEGAVFASVKDVAIRDDSIDLRFKQSDRSSLGAEAQYGSLHLTYRVLMALPLLRRLLMAPVEDEARRHVLELLKLVRIPEPSKIYNEYPHELSGGMQQRVMIAMALACDPELMIADEPTTALDVTTQAQILKLIRDLRSRLNSAILYITHDLAVIAELSDRVAVMYAGKIAEDAPVDELFAHPMHPYTQGLLESIVSMDSRKIETGAALPTIPGTVPDLLQPPEGCRFHPRCKYAFDRCRREDPKLLLRGLNHKVACHLYDQEAPHEAPQ